MKASIIVTPKKSVLDPQGEAVKGAIHSLGMDCVTSARIGKFIELEISGSNAALTRAKMEQVCRDLLSNPVIEDYTLTLLSSSPAAAAKPKVKKTTPQPKPAVPAKKKAKKKKAKKDKKKKKKK